MTALAVLAACSPAGGDDRVDLVIVNRATEAVLVAAEDSRCLDGVAALDGRTILIERPRLSADLRVNDAGARAGRICGAAGSAEAEAAGFGTRIDLIDIDHHLGAIRARGADYWRRHPEAAAFYEDIRNES